MLTVQHVMSAAGVWGTQWDEEVTTRHSSVYPNRHVIAHHCSIAIAHQDRMVGFSARSLGRVQLVLSDRDHVAYPGRGAADAVRWR